MNYYEVFFLLGQGRRAFNSFQFEKEGLSVLEYKNFDPNPFIDIRHIK